MMRLTPKPIVSVGESEKGEKCMGGGNTEDAARLLPFEEQDEVFPFLA